MTGFTHTEGDFPLIFNSFSETNVGGKKTTRAIKIVI